MSLKSDYYKNVLLSISRGYHKGVPSNAKIMYLLAIMKGIERGILLGNRFNYEPQLIALYKETCEEYEPNKVATLFYKPFYHSKGEQYYVLRLKTGAQIPAKSHTPSTKFLREQVEYAALDEELWDLLQDAEIREEYRQALIRRFLQSTK